MDKKHHCIDFLSRVIKTGNMNGLEVVEHDVLNSIPHRPPFLFVDKILHLDDDAIEAERTLRADEGFFKGHYPQFPIMPGVLMCESIFQVAGIFLSKKVLQASDVQGKVPVLTRIQEAKFKRMAFPGDKLTLGAQFDQKVKDFYFFKGWAKKEDSLLLSINFIIGMVEGHH